MTTALHRRKPGLRPRLARVFAAIATSVALVVAPLALVAPAHAAGGFSITGGTTDGWSYELGPMTVGKSYTGWIKRSSYNSSYESSMNVSGLPDGVNWSFDSDAHQIVISSDSVTAEAGSVSFDVTWGDESPVDATFSGAVESGKTGTSTVLTAPAVAPYSSIPLSAVVSPASGPTGTVQFTIAGDAVGGPIALPGDNTVATSAVVGNGRPGQTLTVVANYSGDGDYAASSDSKDVFIYGSDTAKGQILSNGTAVASAVVELLDSTGTTVLASTTSASDGSYSFTRTVSNKADAETLYVLRATIGGQYYFYERDAQEDSVNVTTLAGASKTGPVKWFASGGVNIVRYVSGVAPTWTDNTLAALQQSASFSDGVAAAGDATIVYTVSAGALPAGLALNSATGAIVGTPTSEGAYDFTLTATNDYGHVDQQFTGTIAAAPVIDLALDFKAGTSITDASSTISAGGLKVGSTYTLTMHSTPVILYTGTIGASGGFTWKVALPADTPAGAHTLILTGVAPDGSTMTARAWFTLGANGKMLAISYTGPTALAYTGASDPTLPLGIALSLLLFGILAVIVARRRRRA